MKYQLISRDEYGTSAIVGTFGTTDDAIHKARTVITDANFSNSLSSAEQMKSVECYMIDFTGERELDVYAGTLQHSHMSFKTGSSTTSIDKILDSTPIKVYVGSKFSKNKDKTSSESFVFMNDDKGRPITSLSHGDLKGKTVYFIRPV